MKTFTGDSTQYIVGFKCFVLEEDLQESIKTSNQQSLSVSHFLKERGIVVTKPAQDALESLAGILKWLKFQNREVHITVFERDRSDNILSCLIEVVCTARPYSSKPWNVKWNETVNVVSEVQKYCTDNNIRIVYFE